MEILLLTTHSSIMWNLHRADVEAAKVMRKTKINAIFFHKTFLEAFELELGDELSRMSNGKQKGYIVTFWDNYSAIKSNRHNASKDPETFPLSRDILNRNFGDTKEFNCINNNGYYLKPANTKHRYSFSTKQKVGYYYYAPTNWLERKTRAYQGWKEKGIVGTVTGYKLSPLVKSIINNWNSISRPTKAKYSGFINSQGVKSEDVAHAIQRDLSETEDSCNINTMVCINRAALEEHKTELETLKNYMDLRKIEELSKDSLEFEKCKEMAKRGEREREERHEEALGGGKTISPRLSSVDSLFDKDISKLGVASRVNEINKLLSSENSTYPVTYFEASTGRYIANGATLQGYNKSVRYAALRGYFEYDMNAAHQNILIQLIDRDKLCDLKVDHLREYAKNKQLTRSKLAKEIRTNESIIKKVIIALTYGSQLKTDYDRSISKACNYDKILTRRVVDNLWLKGFVRESKKVSKYLIKESSEITNIIGITRPTQYNLHFDKLLRMNDSKSMAHILQGHERQILDAIIKRSERDDIALLLHDCAIFYNKQSATSLSKIVKEETGFEIEFSEEEY